MISFDLLLQCNDYASYQLEDARDLYISRGQNLDRIFNQCLTGKLGEWNLYFELRASGYHPSMPNMAKISNSKKYETPDIVCGSKRIHVKTLTAEAINRWGKSFQVQDTDQAVTKPSDNDYYFIMRETNFPYFKRWKVLKCKGLEYGETIFKKPGKLAYYIKD